MRDNEPCFTFLDPEGFTEVPWETTVKPCLDRKRTELLMYFSLMGVSRCLEDPKSCDSLTAFFGCEDWKQHIREKDRYEKLVELYMKRLNEKRDWVLRTPPMTNQKNSPIYCLIFATNNDTAFGIWNNDVLPRVQKIWNEKDLGEWMKRMTGQTILTRF